MVAASTSSPKSKSNRTNSIGGFFVDKIDGDVMRAYLTTANIPTDKVDSRIEDNEQLGVALSLYFREVTEESEMCKCEPCGGEAPVSLEACPYCGLVASVDDETTSTEQLSAKVEAEEPKKTSKKKNKSDATTTPEETPKATKETEMTAATAHVNGKSTKTSAALATTPKKGSKAIEVESEIVYTSKDLDKAVERVVRLKSMAATSYWALGNELRAINEQKLWKHRVNAAGKAKYTSFDQFSEQEVKISNTHAYNLIEIAKDYSEEDVREFGTSKLAIMLKAAPEDRPALKEKAKTLGKRALAAEVQKAKKERGHGAKKSKQAEAASKGGKAKAAKTAKLTDKITIAKIEGRRTVKLFAKPDSIRNVDFSTLKRAKTLDAQPFGKLELTNEVTMLFSLVKTDAGLELLINTRRDSSEE